jgi:hypothetical protein
MLSIANTEADIFVRSCSCAFVWPGRCVLIALSRNAHGRGFLLIREHGAAKLGWIIVGRMAVVEGLPTNRKGIVAIEPHTIRSHVGWDQRLAGTNDDMSRFGIMPSCGGVRTSTQSYQTGYCQNRTHCIFSDKLALFSRKLGAVAERKSFELAPIHVAILMVRF